MNNLINNSYFLFFFVSILRMAIKMKGCGVGGVGGLVVLVVLCVWLGVGECSKERGLFFVLFHYYYYYYYF